MRRNLMASSLFAAFLGLSPAMAAAEIALRFGIYTSDKASEMVRQFRPLLNTLEQDLGARLGETVTISMQVAASYETGIADIVDGRVDFSRFGPASYVLATRANPGLHLLAAENNKGGKRFNGLIIVRADSPVRNVSELRGKRFAFGDPNSTIGRYLSQQQLLAAGINANELAGHDYLHRHDAVAKAVAAGDFDAGAVKSRTLAKALARGAPLRALVAFENMTKPWIARADLDPALLAALREVLLALRDPVALEALGKDGFFPAEDREYQFIRDAMLASEAFGG